MDLTGKTVIVTGATRGIGRAIAVKLSELGANIVAVYKQSHEQAAILGMQITKNLLLIQADVSKEEDVKKIFEQAESYFETIDIVVNNAGINFEKSVLEMSLEDWNNIIAVDLTSVFLMSKYAIPYLEKTQGQIINISSRKGFTDLAEENFSAYGAVKAGVTHFTISLSKELVDKKIRVNAIIPTPTKTDLFDEVFTKEDEADLIKKGKLGTPEEVADIVIQAIEDKDATGQIFVDHRVNIS